MNIVMFINVLISIILGIVFVLSSFTHILQFQLNEYLFLRFKGYMEDVGWFNALFPSKLRFPAKSIRNLLILSTVFATILIYDALLLYFVKNEVLFLLLLILAYFIAKVGVVLGVILTTPLAMLMRHRLILIAKRQLANSQVKIIAVTGSYGKSSVKEFLHRLLSTKYLTGKTRGNHNTEVGIAIELGLQVTKDMKYFIAEMGAYTRGDIARLCGLYKPEMGIITGIGNQHISLFGSQKNIIEGKFEMVEGVNGNCYVNIDWPGSEEVIREYRKRINDGSGKTDKRIITYGSQDFADVVFNDLGFDKEFSKFGLHLKGQEVGFSLRTKLIGIHNLINLIPAILIAQELGVEEEKIKNAVENIEPILGKLSLHDSSLGFKILNDSYNSNVNGFLAAMTSLKQVSGSNKGKLFVSSLGIFELGNEKNSSYIEIVEKLKEMDITLLTTDPAFRDIDREFGFEHQMQHVLLFNDEVAILRYIKKNLAKKDTLLLEGRHSPFFTTSLGIKKAY